MKILHTSDWHLGRHLEGRSRLKEQKEVMDEIVNIAESEGVNLVLVAGDVFDTYNPPAEAEELFYETIEKLGANGQRAVVVIAGNHDSPDRVLASDPLARKHGIFLFGYPAQRLNQRANESMSTIKLVQSGPGWVELSLPACSSNAVVTSLPYPSEQRLNEILSASLEDGEMQKAYSERVASVLAEGAANFRKDTVNLVVSHLFVLGGRSSDSEREIQLGGAYIVEPKGFPKADYIALGHLHRPQAVGGTSGRGRYSGSPLCYSFSEADQHKEVVIAEIEPGQEPVVRSIKLQSGRPLRRLRFNSYEEAVAWASEETNQMAWVEMEVAVEEAMTSSMLGNLRKLHDGIINIRPILPGIVVQQEDGERISELSLEEKFRRFVIRETGSEPDPELLQMLIELLEGGSDGETNSTAV